MYPTNGDKRRKPGPPIKVSTKTAIGKAQKTFSETRANVQKVGWEKRRELYGTTGRRQKDG